MWPQFQLRVSTQLREALVRRAPHAWCRATPAAPAPCPVQDVVQQLAGVNFVCYMDGEASNGRTHACLADA